MARLSPQLRGACYGLKRVTIGIVWHVHLPLQSGCGEIIPIGVRPPVERVLLHFPYLASNVAKSARAP